MADAELTVKISADTGSLDSAIRKVNNELTGMEKNIESKGKNLKSIGEGIDTVTKPIQRLAAVTAAGGVAAAKFAIDFEDSFAGVKKTVDGTPEQLDRIRQSIIDMSTKGINGHSAIPQTTKELNELAAAGGQLGIQTENIADFTETMAMLGSATNLSGEEGAKTLARFMNVAGVSQDKIGNLGSAIVDLGNNFATTEAEIADMAMNMGATGAAVGISAQDILAYSTTLSSLGAEAAAGGSAISRIWMDIQQAVSEGGSALESFAATSGKSSAEFADSWKKDASGAFRDFIEGLGKSEDIIGKLQELGFSNIRDLQALQKLAGPQGLELLNNALEMSNSAWEENTALQNEFNAKSETTASQLAVTKNNLIEAGRAVGETLLPAVSGGAVKVKEFAQGIADMSDGQKQALVTTGKWVIGLGATGKAASSVLKGVGNMTEAVGKIKSATAAGGVLGKLAPALTSIGAAAPYAAAGIAAVGTAVYVGKKAYDAWYDSQYRWSEGLADADNNVQKSLDSYKNISKIQKELKDARLIISNPESSQEQVDAAKNKIEEIKDLLEQEYNLKINSDNSDLDNTVDSLKKLTGNELKQAIAEESSMLSDLKEKYKQSLKELPQLQEQYSNANERLTYLKLLNSEYGNLFTEAENGIVTQEQLSAAMQETAEFIGISADKAKEFYDGVSPLETVLSSAQKEVDDLKPKIDDLTKAQQDYINISTSFSNKLTEFFGEQLVQGDFDGAAKTLQRLGKAAADAGLDLQGYSEILTNLARASGMINENQTIQISAEGDVSILEKVEDAANSLNGKSVEVSVNADGTQAYATIDGVEYKIASYDGETGEAILTADGSTADMVINLTTGEVRTFSSEEGKATLSAIDNASSVVQQAAEAISSLKDKTVTITTVVKNV
ncbi:MAG: phage tail tape measure protein, partial [Monoglobaceae bacterium]